MDKMIKGILNTVLWILALFCMGYAIYRSTAVKEVKILGNQEITLGETQHGLIFGLCFIAGICILGSVLLILDKREVRFEDREALSKRTL
jgi:hypothetical protein